jgi:hypothetical protein
MNPEPKELNAVAKDVTFSNDVLSCTMFHLIRRLHDSKRYVTVSYLTLSNFYVFMIEDRF